MLMMPIFNYVDGNHDVISRDADAPGCVSGLCDGGAHCGMICDASIPTFMLTHWARDRTRGEKLAARVGVKKQTQDTAELFGFSDRGTIEPGKRADLNVIDYDHLTLRAPQLAHDLPAGGRRLLQQAEGYDATIVAGTADPPRRRRHRRPSWPTRPGLSTGSAAEPAHQTIVWSVDSMT